MNNAAGVCPTWKLTAPPGCYGDRQQPQQAQRVRPLCTCVWTRGGCWEGGNLMDTNGGSLSCSKGTISEKVQKMEVWKVWVIMSSCKRKHRLDKHWRERETVHRADIRTCQGMSISPSRVSWNRRIEPVALVQLVNLVWSTAELKTDTVMDFRIINLVHYTLF